MRSYVGCINENQSVIYANTCCFIAFPFAHRHTVVTYCAKSTMSFFLNNSGQPSLNYSNWPPSSPIPTSVSMVTRVHLLSPSQFVQQADFCKAYYNGRFHSTPRPYTYTTLSPLRCWIPSQSSCFCLSDLRSDLRFAGHGYVSAHFLMSSGQRRYFHLFPVRYLRSSCIGCSCLCIFANKWLYKMPSYCVFLIIKHLQNLCSSNDQLTSP